VQDETLVAPEAWELDSALMARPGNDEIQLDLFLDYASDVALYPKFQAYFRTQQPQLLAVWGKNDPFFLSRGAEAFERDNPDAETHFYDTGTSRSKPLLWRSQTRFRTSWAVSWRAKLRQSSEAPFTIQAEEVGA